MIPNVGPLELIVILVIALVVLGPKRLPEVGASVGKGLRDFKAAVNGENEGRGGVADAAPLEAGKPSTAATMTPATSRIRAGKSLMASFGRSPGGALEGGRPALRGRSLVDGFAAGE